VGLPVHFFFWGLMQRAGFWRLQLRDVVVGLWGLLQAVQLFGGVPVWNGFVL
jgi:hypothetical protein